MASESLKRPVRSTACAPDFAAPAPHTHTTAGTWPPRFTEPEVEDDEAGTAIREAIEFHWEGLREDGETASEPMSRVEYVEVVA